MLFRSIHRKPQSLYDSDLVEREIERIKRKKRVDKQTLLQERERSTANRGRESMTVAGADEV